MPLNTENNKGYINATDGIEEFDIYDPNTQVVNANTLYPFIRFTNPAGQTSTLDPLTDGAAHILPVKVKDTEWRFTANIGVDNLALGDSNDDVIVRDNATGLFKYIAQAVFATADGIKPFIRFVSGTGINAALGNVEDGFGDDLPLQISTTEVKFTDKVSAQALPDGDVNDRVMVWDSTDKQFKSLARTDFTSSDDLRPFIRFTSDNGVEAALGNLEDGLGELLPFNVSTTEVLFTGKISASNIAAGNATLNSTDEVLVLNPTSKNFKKIDQNTWIKNQNDQAQVGRFWIDGEASIGETLTIGDSSTNEVRITTANENSLADEFKTKLSVLGQANCTRGFSIVGTKPEDSGGEPNNTTLLNNNLCFLSFLDSEYNPIGFIGDGTGKTDDMALAASGVHNLRLLLNTQNQSPSIQDRTQFLIKRFDNGLTGTPIGSFGFGSGIQLAHMTDGKGVVYIKNANALATNNPTNGSILYSEGGVLKSKTSAGVIKQMSSTDDIATGADSFGAAYFDATGFAAPFVPGRGYLYSNGNDLFWRSAAHLPGVQIT